MKESVRKGILQMHARECGSLMSTNAFLQHTQIEPQLSELWANLRHSQKVIMDSPQGMIYKVILWPSHTGTSAYTCKHTCQSRK